MRAKIKVNPETLPEPLLPPTHSVRIDDPPYGYTAEEWRETLQRRAAMPIHRQPEKYPNMWTAEQDNALIALWNEGADFEAMADETGRTPKACQGRIAKLRGWGKILPRKRRVVPQIRWDEEKIAELTELMRKKTGVRKAAQQLGISPTALYKQIQRMEVRPWEQEQG